MNTVQSRRRFLGVLSAGAASAVAPAAVAAALAPAVETAPGGLVPVLAQAPEVDPIFALIDEHRDIRGRCERAHKRFQKLDRKDESALLLPPGIVVGERRGPKVVEALHSADEFSCRMLYNAGEPEPIIAYTLADLRKHAPKELSKWKRAAWVREKAQELEQVEAEFRAKKEALPRSRAWDRWNDLDKELRAATEVLAQTLPITHEGVIATLRYWSEFLSCEEIREQDFDDETTSLLEGFAAALRNIIERGLA